MQEHHAAVALHVAAFDGLGRAESMLQGREVRAFGGVDCLDVGPREHRSGALQVVEDGLPTTRPQSRRLDDLDPLVQALALAAKLHLHRGQPVGVPRDDTQRRRRPELRERGEARASIYGLARPPTLHEVITPREQCFGRSGSVDDERAPVEGGLVAKRLDALDPRGDARTALGAWWTQPQTKLEVAQHRVRAPHRSSPASASVQGERPTVESLPQRHTHRPSPPISASLIAPPIVAFKLSPSPLRRGSHE